MCVLTESEHREDNASSLQDDGEQTHPASGMASVMAKILCKNVNSSKSVILAKCKTDRELSRGKRANKSSDEADLGRVEELQSTKARKDLIVKVGIKFAACFCLFFCNTFLHEVGIIIV